MEYSILYVIYIGMHVVVAVVFTFLPCICAASERCLLTRCFIVAVAEKQRHFIQQGNNTRTQQKHQTVHIFPLRDSKRIRPISKLHFNAFDFVKSEVPYEVTKQTLKNPIESEPLLLDFVFTHLLQTELEPVKLHQRV